MVGSAGGAWGGGGGAGYLSAPDMTGGGNAGNNRQVTFSSWGVIAGRARRGQHLYFLWNLEPFFILIKYLQTRYLGRFIVLYFYLKLLLLNVQVNFSLHQMLKLPKCTLHALPIPILIFLHICCNVCDIYYLIYKTICLSFYIYLNLISKQIGMNIRFSVQLIYLYGHLSIQILTYLLDTVADMQVGQKDCQDLNTIEQDQVAFTSQQYDTFGGNDVSPAIYQRVNGIPSPS